MTTKVKFLACPAAPNPINADGTYYARYSFGGTTRASDPIKNNGRELVRITRPVPPVRSKYWDDMPSQFMLLSDSFRFSGSSLVGVQYSAGDASAAYWGIHLRHSKRANMLLLDGHVEAFTRDVIIDGSASKKYAVSGQLGGHFPDNVKEIYTP